MQLETSSWYIAAQSLRYTPTTTYASPPGQGYSHVPDSYANQAYGYGGNYSGMDDQRMHTFPQASSPSPSVLGSTPTPPSRKKAHTTAVMSLPTKKQEKWNPESTDRCDPDVRQTAAKEKKQLRMLSLIPFLKSSRARPATEIIPDNTLAPESLSYVNVPRSENAQLADAQIDRVLLWLRDLQCPRNMRDADYQSFVRYYQEFFLALRNPMKQPKYEGEDEDDRDSEGVASVDSDSDDDEDWRERERRKWGKAPPPVVEGVPPGAAFQHSAADFMSNGMTPVAAPAIMASGSGAGQQPVLLGWNFPEQMQQQFHSQSPQLWLQRPQSQSPPSWLHPPQQSMSPPPWAYPYAYQRSPAPWGSAPGPDMNQVAANLNALGLYAV